MKTYQVVATVNGAQRSSKTVNRATAIAIKAVLCRRCGEANVAMRRVS